MTRSKYLTARCPLGCEVWLHPKAVGPHGRPGRCQHVAWVDRLEDEYLVAAPFAVDVSRLLPPDLVQRPEFSESRLLRPRAGEYIRDEVCQGIVLHSPVNGVRAQRWATVVQCAYRETGFGAIAAGLTEEGFAAIEQQLLAEGRLATCGDCGETTTCRGLQHHRAQSTACRWRRAADEVRALWNDGWRDPFSIGGVPLTWQELNSRVAWRRRLHVVPFPAWTAVLLRSCSIP